ncbi:MAG TPA: alpha-E domain-containing protein [Caulobacteraceae bacterium]|nr:alpha-E domain-containing protein [Caulobacteraceae bacterium]
MMLARVADSLYWIGRYAERAEHISRVSDVMLTATLDQNDAAVAVAQVALAAVAHPDERPNATALNAVQRLVFDRENLGSVVTSLARARENARQVRDQITTETWERLNLLYLRVTGPQAERAFQHSSSSFLHEIIADLHLFKGAADATMSHGEGWRFLLVGMYLERAQLIARLLDVCFGDSAGKKPLSDHLAQMAVLRMACALEPYLRVHTAEIQPRRLLEFLLFNEDFPRSIRFSTSRIEEHLLRLARHDEALARAGPERLAGRLNARLEFADLDESLGPGAILSAVVAECSRIHHAIYETFVAYPLEQRLPI